MKNVVILVAGGILVVTVITWFLPLPAFLSAMHYSTQILDRNGQVLYEVQPNGLHEGTELKDLPPNFIDALLAVEDRTFYSNPGLSLRGIARALLHDLRAFRFVEGGSTITQQLVRIKLQPEHRSILTKIREAWLALKLTSHFSKDAILEQYLSSAYFGQNAYGVSAAAQTYFSKNPARLSLSESALLVGLLNAPTNLNPFKNLDGANKRRGLVLRSLRDTQKISESDFKDALAEPIVLSSGKVKIRAPHFVMWLLDSRPELRLQKNVRTTLDSDLQTHVESIITNQLQRLSYKNVSSAAVVVLDAHTGDILAMVGSADYFDSKHDGQVNVALAPRQPGSALKPFTYALALEHGMTAASTVEDIESQYFTQTQNSYIPRNYDYEHHGLVRLREALANSYNIAAIKVLEKVGVGNLLAFLQRIGLSTLTETPDHYGLALTLGDSEVRLLELVSAYGIFPRGGKTLQPRALLSDAVDAGAQVLGPRSAWLISDILSDERARLPEFGSDGPLNFDVPVAAKTGTTRNSRDNWTIGYTPDRIVGVWVGNADNTPMRGTSGVTGAGPIFHEVMIAALRGRGAVSFARPPGIVDASVCALSGKLPTALCHNRITEHFVDGTVPLEKDDVYREVIIDRRTNLLASESCDPAFVEKRVFTVFPLSLQAWARENHWPVPPSVFSPLCTVGASSSTSAGITIISPHENADILLDPLVPDDSEQIILEATAPSEIASADWFVNNQKVASASQPDFHAKWKPTVGRHTVTIRSGESESSVTVVIRSSRDVLYPMTVQ